MTAITTLVVLLPLLLTAVICAVALMEHRQLPTRRLVALLGATIIAIPAPFLLARPVVAAVAVFAILFCAFVIPVTRALEKSARTKRPEVRTAPLVPRHLSMYLPGWMRAANLIANLAVLLWFLLRARVATSPLLMPLGFAFAGVTFYLLYETWLRQEVFSVRAANEAERRQRVRFVFGAQAVLTLAFLLMAGLSTGQWPGPIVIGVIAGVIGGVGCALALSTGIQERYLVRPQH